jgi:hypothetical protein
MATALGLPRGRAQTAVPQQIGDGFEIRAPLDQMSGEPWGARPVKTKNRKKDRSVTA